jgi:hypothetical protein
MMNYNYLRQKASPWVSAAVLAGGLVTALILVFLVKLETGINALALPGHQIDSSYQSDV